MFFSRRPRKIEVYDRFDKVAPAKDANSGAVGQFSAPGYETNLSIVAQFSQTTAKPNLLP